MNRDHDRAVAHTAEVRELLLVVDQDFRLMAA